MPDAFKRRLKNWARRKEQLLPMGFSIGVVAAIDATVAVVGGIAALQRPIAEWPFVMIAMAIFFVPEVAFFAFDIPNTFRYDAPVLCAGWLTGTAILLFATTNPITGDFAPLLLGLTVGVVAGITTIRGGVLAAALAATLLAFTTAFHRLNTPALYLSFIVIGWLAGFLMRSQQLLLIEQRQMQDRLSEHAAADERRRIAREIHDVIAHSLSVTLLHLTGARHALQYSDSGADDETVRALRRAEHLGRQAMADIRRTVGLLDAQATALAPEPGIADISSLVDDFDRAGLNVAYQVSGSFDDVSPAAGLALYRIAQESLANVAKHAPHAVCRVALTASPSAATLRAVNALPGGADTQSAVHGRGIEGMIQRIELLGGTIDVGARPDCWSVHATVPSGAQGAEWTPQIGCP